MRYILVLGGTGAMGAHLVNLLKCRSDTIVFVTTRSKRISDANNLRYLVGNAHDLAFVKPLLKSRNWTAIIDFLAYSTVDFTQRALVLLAATQQYVFLSSSRVYDESNEPLTEDSSRLLEKCVDKAYLRTDEYALAKARQEDILRESGKKNWTIIRPYITFSEVRLQLGASEKEGWLYRALHGRTIIFSEDIAYKITTLTYGKDVAHGIESILGNNAAFGETFHITNEKSYKWNDIFKLYAQVFEDVIGQRPKIMLKKHWEPYMGGGKEQVKYDRLFNRRFDNSKIGKYINTSTFSDTLALLTCCLKQFLSNPVFNPIDWAGEARKDRVTKEWAKLSEFDSFKSLVKYIIVRLNLHK